MHNNQTMEELDGIHSWSCLSGLTWVKVFTLKSYLEVLEKLLMIKVL